jgi:hypothetical protein
MVLLRRANEKDGGRGYIYKMFGKKTWKKWTSILGLDIKKKKKT